MSSSAPLITAITRTLSEIGESSASLVPETRDHRHLAQSCELLHRRNAWRFSVTARASAAPRPRPSIYGGTALKQERADFANAEGELRRPFRLFAKFSTAGAVGATARATAERKYRLRHRRRSPHADRKPLASGRRRAPATESGRRRRARAFSGEVGTGSPRKMRPLTENESEFRFHQNGIRASADATGCAARRGHHNAGSESRSMRIRRACTPQPQRLPTENAKKPSAFRKAFLLYALGLRSCCSENGNRRRHADVDQLLAWAKGSAGILPT